MNSKVILRIVAGSAHHFVNLASSASCDFHARPIPERLERVPKHFTIIQLFLLPPSFRSSVGGPPRLLTITSTSPSLSKSPKEQPRARFSSCSAAPAFDETSSKRPFPKLRYKTLGSL